MSRLQDLPENGWLNLVDINIKNKSLKVARFKRIAEEEGETISERICQKIVGIPIDKVLKGNISYKEVKGSKNFSVYREMIKNWCEINYNVPNNRTEVLKQAPRYNTHIRVNNKLYFIRQNYMEVIQDLGDIVDEKEING